MTTSAARFGRAISLLLSPFYYIKLAGTSPGWCTTYLLINSTIPTLLYYILRRFLSLRCLFEDVLSALVCNFQYSSCFVFTFIVFWSVKKLSHLFIRYIESLSNIRARNTFFTLNKNFSLLIWVQLYIFVSFLFFVALSKYWRLAGEKKQLRYSYVLYCCRIEGCINSFFALPGMLSSYFLEKLNLITLSLSSLIVCVFKKLW